MESSSTNTIGKYQIIREIARSNDIVYEAIDPAINRRLAIKELAIPPNLQGAQRRERIERFWREGRAAGKLSHPNIVTIYEVGRDGDRYFIAMEYLEGQTLREVLQAGGALPLNTALDYIFQLCSALAYAHRNGVIHRDIKPENVQILPGNHIKLTDFGIARLIGEQSITQDGQVFGTPSYMSPEQVAGKDIDTRSDIFSLGVLLYEMLSGRKPFAGDSVVTITYNIMNMEPPPIPGVPPYVTAAIRKAMAKDPDLRYSCVEDFERDLREQRSNGAVDAGPYDFNAYPSPFGGATQQPSQPQGPLTPYGTPMPSPGAGGYSTGPVQDPFGSSGLPSAYLPPPPSKPLLSAETRNFLGIFLLIAALTGMLIFAIYAINLAYQSFRTRATSEDAARYYSQGLRLKERGDVNGAIEQWQNAIRVSPGSQYAKLAREGIYAAMVETAINYYKSGNSLALKQVAEDLIEYEPNRPEGHFYLASAYMLTGEKEKMRQEYALAVKYGGNDSYAKAARRQLALSYISEGDSYKDQGRNHNALESYQKAREYADAELMPQIDEKISSVR